MYLTWLNSNSWLIEIGGKRILLDPWLVGPLVFGNMDWFFKGVCHSARQIPEQIDLLLLSQGLPDHAHPLTLQQLDRSIPVVASPNAAKVVRSLGYTEVTALAHGEEFTLDEHVKIRALPGSAIGPMLVENGYWLQELVSGTTLYYEPHGYHAPVLKDLAPIDVTIAPIVDLALPVVGPIIRGTKNALELAEWVRPQVMLPTADGGDVVYEGLLAAGLRSLGSIESFRAMLADKELSAQVIEPKPGDRIEIKLQQRVLG